MRLEVNLLNLAKLADALLRKNHVSILAMCVMPTD